MRKHYKKPSTDIFVFKTNDIMSDSNELEIDIKPYEDPDNDEPKSNIINP